MNDVEEIKKLKARYFRGLDSQDWDLYGSVFAEDVIVDTSRAGGEIVHGRAPMVAYARGLQMVQSVHQGHMPEIELTSETTATSASRQRPSAPSTDTRACSSAAAISTTAR